MAAASRRHRGTPHLSCRPTTQTDPAISGLREFIQVLRVSCASRPPRECPAGLAAPRSAPDEALSVPSGGPFPPGGRGASELGQEGKKRGVCPGTSPVPTPAPPVASRSVEGLMVPYLARPKPRVKGKTLSSDGSHLNRIKGSVRREDR